MTLGKLRVGCELRQVQGLLGKAPDMPPPSLKAVLCRPLLPYPSNAITSPSLAGRGEIWNPYGVGRGNPWTLALLPSSGRASLSHPAQPPTTTPSPLSISPTPCLPPWMGSCLGESCVPCALFCPGLALCWRCACRLHNKLTWCLCVYLGWGGVFFFFFVLLGSGPHCMNMWNWIRPCV